MVRWRGLSPSETLLTQDAFSMFHGVKTGLAELQEFGETGFGVSRRDAKARRTDDRGQRAEDRSQKTDDR